MCLVFLALAISWPGMFSFDFVVFVMGGFALVFGAMFARTLRHGVPRIAVKLAAGSSQSRVSSRDGT